MCSGTIVLYKRNSDVTEEMMNVVSNDFVKSLTGLYKPAVPSENSELVLIKNRNNAKISVNKGECLVLLDLDNKVIPEISASLFEKNSRSEYSISIHGKTAFDNTELWSYIPANPLASSLFYCMSYVDNLILKKGNSKLANFWLLKKYKRTIISEYREICGDAVAKMDLFDLNQQDLYQLLYQRVLLEKPQVLFIVQPFNRMDMYQRIRVLEYMSKIQKEGISIVILAVSLSDSLQLASRLVLMQNHKIIKVLNSNEFEQAAEYGLIVK